MKGGPTLKSGGGCVSALGEPIVGEVRRRGQTWVKSDGGDRRGRHRVVPWEYWGYALGVEECAYGVGEGWWKGQEQNSKECMLLGSGGVGC